MSRSSDQSPGDFRDEFSAVSLTGDGPPREGRTQ